MKFISNLIPLGDALAKIDGNQKLMDTEKVHIRDSQGRCSDCRGYIWSFQ